MKLLYVRVSPFNSFSIGSHIPLHMSLPVLEPPPLVSLCDCECDLSNCHLLHKPHFGDSFLQFQNKLALYLIAKFLSYVIAARYKVCYSALRQRNGAWFGTRLGEHSWTICPYLLWY